MEEKYNIQNLQEQQANNERIKFLHFWRHTNNKHEKVDKSCLSQWFESPFEVEGIVYKTAEHWMMAGKAKLFGDTEMLAQILQCQTPGEAQKLGRKVRGYDGEIWKENRFEIVKQGNVHKFGQNELLKEYLLQTGERVLVEASPYDKIWGIGLTQDDEKANNVYQWQGLNLLGFALMAAREELARK